MSGFDAVVKDKNSSTEEVLTAFFSVTGGAVEEKMLKRNLGKWRKVTQDAFDLLRVHRPEIVSVFDMNHPMSRVRGFAA